MSDTYVGWDGKSYPWPPPENWYHASDGRWWAPGTGPNPPQQAQPPAQEQAAAATPSLFAPDDTAALPQPDPSFELQRSTAPAEPLDEPPSFGRYAAEQPAEDEQSGGGVVQALLIIVGIVALALIAGFAYFIISADTAGDDLATSDSTGAEPALGAIEAPDTSGTGDDTTGDGTTADETTTDETTTDGVLGDGTAPDTDTTSTTQPGTDTTLATGTDAQIAEFREMLNDNNLTSESLEPDQIMRFAESFCGFARSAEDPDAFDEVRQAAIAATETDLSTDELRLVIDAVIVTFCPEQATRLGVDV